MVTTLGLGKFYGSVLPRPWIYTDVEFSENRVDPPPYIVDPLLTLAKEAHWSMGELRFTRLRLQGRIEVKISKLRAQKEKEELDAKDQEKDKGRIGLKVEDEEEVSRQTTSKVSVAQKKRKKLFDSVVKKADAHGGLYPRRRGTEANLGFPLD